MENRIITLKDITPAFGMADYVGYVLKEEFDRRPFIEDYDPIVMYIRTKGETMDYFFDLAHVAATLSPMSIWDIPEDSRKECKEWLDDTLSLRQLLQMLTDYAAVLDFVEENPDSSLPDDAITKHAIPERTVSDETPIQDDYVEVHLNPLEGADAEWIGCQIYEMSQGNPEPTFVLCIRSEATQICNWILRKAYEAGKESFDEAIRIVKECPFYFQDWHRAPLEEVERLVRELFEKKHCSRIYIEDIWFINSKEENDTNKYLNTIQRLRLLAKELDTKFYLCATDIDLFM